MDLLLTIYSQSPIRMSFVSIDLILIINLDKELKFDKTYFGSLEVKISNQGQASRTKAWQNFVAFSYGFSFG